MEQCHFQHSRESERLSIFPTCAANWYARKLTSINNRNPQTHRKVELLWKRTFKDVSGLSFTRRPFSWKRSSTRKYVCVSVFIFLLKFFWFEFQGDTLSSESRIDWIYSCLYLMPKSSWLEASTFGVFFLWFHEPRDFKHHLKTFTSPLKSFCEQSAC